MSNNVQQARLRNLRLPIGSLFSVYIKNQFVLWFFLEGSRYMRKFKCFFALMICWSNYAADNGGDERVRVATILYNFDALLGAAHERVVECLQKNWQTLENFRATTSCLYTGLARHAYKENLKQFVKAIELLKQTVEVRERKLCLRHILDTMNYIPCALNEQRDQGWRYSCTSSVDKEALKVYEEVKKPLIVALSLYRREVLPVKIIYFLKDHQMVPVTLDTILIKSENDFSLQNLCKKQLVGSQVPLESLIRHAGAVRNKILWDEHSAYELQYKNQLVVMKKRLNKAEKGSSCVLL